MSKFVINGGKKLKGEIEVNGAKNDALVIFSAALLTSSQVNMGRIPEIEDIKRMSEMIENIGVRIKNITKGTYEINASSMTSSLVNPEIAKKLRASILLTAPILARTGKVFFPHPGGCVIGERPINLFLEGYKAMGAKVKYDKNLYNITSPELRGAKFTFDTISVTGTEALMMAGSLANGVTTLKNCACEPEVISLAEFLNNCGAKIIGAGSPEITIEGVKKLKGSNHEVIPDRVEAGSFAILAVAMRSHVNIKKCNPEHLDSLWSFLKQAGANIKIKKDSVEILPSVRLSSASFKTREYPGFPTDLQAPACVLLTQSDGQALVHETIYEGRLLWAEDLKRMGANILTHDPHRISVTGPSKLKGREIESPDIRAGMAYIIAGLCAKGQTTIHNIYQIDRGYERVEERLRKIGAEIYRI